LREFFVQERIFMDSLYNRATKGKNRISRECRDAKHFGNKQFTEA